MPETIGQQLKQAREARRLTLEKASQATHIRPHFLQALEADDYSAMSSAAQARGFLKNYCSFLELNLDELLAAVQQSRLSQVDEIHGPLAQVEIAPPPPEPASKARPTQPIRVEPEAQPAQSLSWAGRLRRLAGRSEETPQPQLPAQPEPAPPASAASLAQEVTRPVPSALQAGGNGKLEESEVLGRGSRPAEEGPASAEIQSPEPRSGGRLKSLFGVRLSRVKPPDVSAEQEAVAEEEGAQASETPPAQPEPLIQPAAQVAEESAEKIFIEIGRELHMRRELLSLTHEEVERHIHVRAVFIDALERGDFAQLPSAVQTRGMLANYASFLDLDTDALLLRFADSLQASHRARHPRASGSLRQPLPVKPTMPPLRSFVAGDLVFGLAVVVMVVALIVWGLGRIFEDQAVPVALPTVPSVSDVLAGTSAPQVAQEVTLIPVEDTPLVVEESTSPPVQAVEEVPALDPAVPVNLTVVATERTFMRVLVDGEEIFNGRVTAGVAYSYEATTTIRLLAGNGAALRVTYNGRDLGLLGTFGEVVEFIYTADDIMTPLPVASATPTASPVVSETPSPTLSPTPTSARTPTPAEP